jgi:hypothetical protein
MKMASLDAFNQGYTELLRGKIQRRNSRKHSKNSLAGSCKTAVDGDAAESMLLDWCFLLRMQVL